MPTSRTLTRRRLPLPLIAVLLSGGCARTYVAHGVVLRVDPPSSVVTISHDAIGDFMAAMAMPFEIRERARFERVKPGDRVRFRLVVHDGRSVVDRLEVISAPPTDSGLARSPAVSTLVAPGARVPNFELTDQTGSAVSLASLRGRVVAVNFLYTRCPLADYCPRMVAHFSGVRARFADRIPRDLALLTITFDPTHDTVETLRQYAATHRAGGPGWRFLTGSADQVQRVCEAFGLEYWPDEGLITHTLQTAVIDREGRLVASVEGKDFTARQLGDLIETVLNQPAAAPAP